MDVPVVMDNKVDSRISKTNSIIYIQSKLDKFRGPAKLRLFDLHV